jgi:adapter protein MecA 1/2
MMQQANFEFGFEAEDIPLMIEAIPMNAECIVLIITKVEDPEELDTRFSRFAPSVHEASDNDEHDNDIQIEGSDEVLDLFRKIQAQEPVSEESPLPLTETDADAEPRALIRLFKFDNIRTILSMSSGLQISFSGESALYKSIRSDAYLLLLKGNSASATEYNKLCNRISEYGKPQKVLSTTPAYLSEHCECIIPNDALNMLANI